MLPQNYEIQPFDMKNIPLMLEVVVPMWSPPTWDMNFRRFYVEGIIRRNYLENQLHYQLIERAPDGNSQFTAMAFFARKNDVCKGIELRAEFGRGIRFTRDPSVKDIG